MKSPVILEGVPFDWEASKKMSERVVNDEGEVSWFAAMSADPGCMQCPSCGEYLWREGRKVQCPECEHVWEVDVGKHGGGR